jgi:hypothetical protein
MSGPPAYGYLVGTPEVKARWAMRREALRLAGHNIQVSHADKVFFPGDQIGKAGLIDYYRRICSAMLPVAAIP